MDLSKVLSIAGKGGLFKVVSQGKNSVIVESLLDGKRFPAFGHEKISSLEEIAVFTYSEDMPLKEVFRSIHNTLETNPLPEPGADHSTLRKFFLAAVPEFDQERVYTSDIKKIVAWYALLIKHELLDFTPEPVEDSGEAPSEEKENGELDKKEE